jgi:hypothetical protein
MKRVALAMAAGVVLLAALPGLSLAVPPGTLDQSQDTVTNSIGSEADVYQTFTVGQTGTLTGVQVWMNGNGESTATVGIQATTSGDPSLTDLATVSAAPPPTAAFVDFILPTGLAVTAGDVLAIRINCGSSTAAWGSATNTYASGQALEINGGWVNPTGILDFTFRTYVLTATQPTPVRTGTPPPTTAGAGSSSDRGADLWLLPFGLVTLVATTLFVAKRRPRPIR